MPSKEEWAKMTPEQKEKDRERMSRWRKANKEKCQGYQRKARIENPDSILNIDLKYRYGITLEQYNEMLVKQDYKCAICRTDDPGRGSKRQKRFFVDHCHDNKKVRGLLCIMCNMSIGGFNDDINVMYKAIDYIKYHHDEVKETAGNTQWL